MSESPIIRIHNLRQQLKIGVTEEERAWPQLVRMNIEVFLRSPDSVHSDDLGETLDYMAAIEAIKRLAGEQEWSLLERLCFDVGNELLSLSSQVQSVRVESFKNVHPSSDAVSVEMMVHRETSLSVSRV